MKIIMILLLSLILSGCEFFYPDTSKAITEKQQYSELQKQNVILIDIANSLKLIAQNTRRE